ncbi:glyoxalase [Flavobacterium sp.]|uniref:glyoxalase n=1 Tax=Flavobacterium sp. TaxID=239 RepID=UPI002610A5FE|nr:glyoxalase [Flavobacterium sp.]
MSARDPFLRDFRGEMIGTVTSQSSADEFFQNQTLRPILKLQNDLFIEVFRNYIAKSKTDFYNFNVEKKLTFIEHSIQRDIKFRNSLKGIVIGLFTLEEYNRYIQNSSDLNKRMMSMLIERLKNQVQLFELQF